VSRAIFLYELAIHFDPSCAEAWNNLGVLQRDLGNFEGGPLIFIAHKGHISRLV